VHTKAAGLPTGGQLIGLWQSGGQSKVLVVRPVPKLKKESEPANIK
jgi:hypothetical protein